MATGIVLRSILPKKPVVDLEELTANYTKLLNTIGSGILKDFKATYPKPKYKYSPASRNKSKVSVFSEDEILGYAVLGTKPHMILPRRSPVLRFQTGYTRKVTPGKIGRNPGGGSFGDVVFTRGPVRHPGYGGSHIDETIAEKWEPILQDDAKQAIKDATH